MAQSTSKKNPILTKFAKNVRIRRHMLGLTQEELAEKADLYVNYVAGIERATRNPSLTSIVVVASTVRTGKAMLVTLTYAQTI